MEILNSHTCTFDLHFFRHSFTFYWGNRLLNCYYTFAKIYNEKTGLMVHRSNITTVFALHQNLYRNRSCVILHKQRFSCMGYVMICWHRNLGDSVLTALLY